MASDRVAAGANSSRKSTVTRGGGSKDGGEGSSNASDRPDRKPSKKTRRSECSHLKSDINRNSQALHQPR